MELPSRRAGGGFGHSVRGDVTSNCGCTVSFTSVSCRLKPITAPPRARGRCPRRAVGEWLLSQTKVRSRRNERFAPQGESLVYLYIAFAGFCIQYFESSTELPSRRAGGAFGHPDRVVSNNTSDTQYRTFRREHGGFGHSVREVLPRIGVGLNNSVCWLPMGPH